MQPGVAFVLAAAGVYHPRIVGAQREMGADIEAQPHARACQRLTVSFTRLRVVARYIAPVEEPEQT